MVFPLNATAAVLQNSSVQTFLRSAVQVASQAATQLSRANSSEGFMETASAEPAAGSPLECTYANFWSTSLTTSQKCNQLALGSCQEDESIVNFFALFWCYLDESAAAYIIISILLIFLIFKFISGTIEEFCAPSIQYLTKWLNLSEALAAVTLLAFANGVGDVITAIVAGDTDDGISYNIGSLYGAGMFTCALIIALIIFRSPKDVIVTPSSLYRDITVNSFATIFILIVSIFGKITVAIAACLLVIYLILVTVVYIQDYKASQECKGKESTVVKAPKAHATEEVPLVKNLEAHPTEEMPLVKNPEQSQSIDPVKKKPRLKNLAKKLKYQFLVMTIATKFALIAKFKYRQEQHEKPFSERSFLEKVNYIIDFPFEYLRKLTIPPCDDEKFSKTWFVLWPFPGLLLLAWIFTKSPSLLWIYVIVPLGIILMIVFYFTTPHNGKPRYLPAVVILGLLMSLVWAFIMSSILVDLLQMWTVYTGISPTYMGLTIIAMGSALPDGVTTLTLANQGLGDMAITGNYSSQCFALLIGFGLSMLKKTITQGTQYFNLWDMKRINSNCLDVLAIMSTLLVFLVSFIYGVTRKYHYDKILAIILIVIYFVFFALATYFAIAIMVAGGED